jgi:hypothetical protein
MGYKMIRYELISQHNYPNINIWSRWENEEFSGFKFEAAEGYVMYNPNEIFYELNIETDEEIPVFYYYTQYNTSAKYVLENFPYIAVPRIVVDENYIF